MSDPRKDISGASSAGSAAPITLYPRPQWSPLSGAAVACCILFALAVFVAAMIHPNIPVALVQTIVALPHNHLDAGMNVLFGDFRVEWRPEPDAARIRAEHPPTTSPASQP